MVQEKDELNCSTLKSQKLAKIKSGDNAMDYEKMLPLFAFFLLVQCRIETINFIEFNKMPTH